MLCLFILDTWLRIRGKRCSECCIELAAEALPHLLWSRYTSRELMHFYATVIRPVLVYCAPVWHHAITRSQAEQLESIEKPPRYSHYLSFYSGHVVLFVDELTSLESRRDQLPRSLFQDISHPSSLCHLFPPSRDTHVWSRLSQNSHTVYTSYLTHQTYCSFINYAWNHYRVPPRNN